MDKKIEKHSEINNLIYEEYEFINILKGYCEYERETSEEISRILVLVKLILKLHEQIFDEMDNLLIGS